MSNRTDKIGCNGSAGFSLVEILVALIISLFILGGAVTILIQNQQNYRQNDDFGRLQENARFALDLIISDLRMAGFLGCVRNNTPGMNIRNKIFSQLGADDLLNITFSLDGFEQDSVAWKSGSADVVADILPGTDAITIRKLRNAGLPVSASIAASDAVPVLSAASFSAGQLAAVYNCNATDIFQISAVAGNTIEHASNFSNDYEQNTAHSANPAADPNGLSAQTFIAPFDAVRYYIADDNGGPALWRQFHNNVEIVEQPILEGIENMQIRYGIDNMNFDGAADSYVDANGVTDWSLVVAVRLVLLVRTIGEYGATEDTGKYDINDTPDNDGDDWGPTGEGVHYQRKLVTATVMLRNLQTKVEPPT